MASAQDGASGPRSSRSALAFALASSARDRWLRSAEEGYRRDLAQAGGPSAGEVMTGRVETVDRASRVSPGLAFLASAILPGAGQLLEGRNRAFAYLGAETMAWIAHFAWLDAGNKKEGEYEAYARRHWDLDRWRATADSCLTAIPPGVNRADAESTLIHFLDEENYQHYYEDIGKLEAYRGGWDDFPCPADPNAIVISPNRGEYRSMRDDSNSYLDKARFATTFAFLNRVVSAVDAYRTARGARLKIAQGTDLELDFGGSLERPRAALRVRKRW